MTPICSLRPLLPRHCRSPNWRGTGFSTAFRLHNPLSALSIQGALHHFHSGYMGRGWMTQKNSFGGDLPPCAFRVLEVFCKFFKTLAFWLYIQLRKCVQN